MGKKSSKTYPIKPLIHGSTQNVTIEHDYRQDIVQYEFYIPAAIWQHSAVKKFITQLSKMDPSATIFKGVTGVWKGEQEDTYIYRLIFHSGVRQIYGYHVKQKPDTPRNLPSDY